MKNLVLLLSIFFCHQIAAMTPAWLIQPKVCLADKIGQACELSLNIMASNLPSGQHCLFLNGQQLSCHQQREFKKSLLISINEPSILELKNSQHQTILAQPLSIKYLQVPTQRRRIRNPWSLF